MTDRLKTVFRDIRITRAAQGITRHHSCFEPLVFLRTRGLTLVTRNRSQTDIHIALRLSPVVNRQATGAPRFATDPGAIQALAPALERVFREEAIVERVLKRTTRIETSEAFVRSQPQAPAQADAIPIRDLEKVVVRSALPASVREDASSGADPAARTAKTQSPVSHTGLSAVDINRLTDQVVTAIDRRINAHRERLGRR